MRRIAERARRADPALAVRGVLLLAALLAAVFGLVGFRSLDPPIAAGDGTAAGFTDHLYWTLQLFLLDSAPLQDPRPTGVLLEIARFLAPATTASAVAVAAREVLARFWNSYRTPRRRDHTVVVGDGPAALRVVRSVLDEGRTCVLVDPHDPVRHPRRDRALSRSRAATVIRLGGDARQPAVLRAAGGVTAREIVAVGDDDAGHVQIAAAARSLLPEPSGPDRDLDRDLDPVTAASEPPAPVCVVEVGSAATATALAADELSRPRSVRVEFVDRNRRAARAVLDGELPALATITALAVLGAGPLFEALCAEATARVGAARTWAGADAGVLDAGTPDLVVVAVEEVGEAARLALEAFARVRGAAIGIVVATGVAASLGDQLVTSSPTGARFSVVNAVDLVRDIALLRHGLYGDLARAIHESYVRAEEAKGNGPAQNPSTVPWTELPESLRESNRAQAFHTGAKMRAIGCAVVPEGAAHPAVPFDFQDQEIDRLAVMEHNRWARDRLGSGWTPGPKDVERMRSPYLVSWQNLPDDAVDDVREKDRQAVRDLPEHIRAAGLEIIRL